MQLNTQVQQLRKTISGWMKYYKEREFLEVCPICEHPGLEIKDNLRPPIEDCHLVQCTRCGFVTYNPWAKDLTDYYKENTKQQCVAFIQTKQKKLVCHNSLLFKYLKEEKSDIVRHRFLDYGCSDGYLMEAYEEWFNTTADAERMKAETYGIELNKGHANWGTYFKGLKNISTKPDLDQYEDNKFDVISLYHVLEHVQQPKQFMEKLVSKLSPNGLLYIALPTINRMDYQHGFHVPTDPPEIDVFFKDEHINIFSDELFEKFISNLGMEKVFMDTKIYGTCMIFRKIDVGIEPVAVEGYGAETDYEPNKQLLEDLCFACETRRDIEELKTAPVEALELADIALERYPLYRDMISLACHFRDPAERELYLEEMYQKTGLYEVKVERAFIFFSMELFDEAEKLLVEVLGELGYNDQVVAHLGYLNFHKGNIPECIKYFKLLLEYNPYDAGRIATCAAVMAQL